ncbi:anti-anti-sigma factor [Nocardia tenerifensis]|uniref:Anti-sigma factor antagonist n=1 Tax=Nocardia tenerifensis TaxID=228006 RepID=A0A318KB83_9NOCA|nr:STAS domain-containing protein [Nocardia tenerifensis]PXX71376.1 anti-anti-sigma factor [Nocardia tenerifensis]
MSGEARALAIRQDWTGSAAVLTVGGEVDAASAPQLQAALTTALDQEPTVLVVDLSAVRFFGSAGLSVLLFAAEKLAKDALRVVASPQVRRPIEVTGLDGLLEVFATVDEALTPGETPSIA